MMATRHNAIAAIAPPDTINAAAPAAADTTTQRTANRSTAEGRAENLRSTRDNAFTVSGIAMGPRVPVSDTPVTATPLALLPGAHRPAPAGAVATQEPTLQERLHQSLLPRPAAVSAATGPQRSPLWTSTVVEIPAHLETGTPPPAPRVPLSSDATATPVLPISGQPQLPTGAHAGSAVAPTRNGAPLQEQLLAQLRGAIETAVGSPEPRLTLELTSPLQGQIHVQLTVQDDRLNVQLRIDNQPLLETVQRHTQSLKDQLGHLGFREITVSCNHGRHGDQQHSRERQHGDGNDNPDKVRLPGQRGTRRHT